MPQSPSQANRRRSSETNKNRKPKDIETTNKVAYMYEELNYWEKWIALSHGQVKCHNYS